MNAPFARLADSLFGRSLCYTKIVSLIRCHDGNSSVLSFLVYAIPFILGVLLLISLFNIQSNFRRGRTAPYFRIRRDSTYAAWRWLLIAIVAIAGIAGALYARRSVPPPNFAAIALPNSEAESPTPILPTVPTITPDANAATKDYIAAPPTITPTQPTPSVTPTPFISTIVALVTPSPNAKITITALSSSLSNTLDPVNANTQFPAGIPRIYVWFEYSGMADGVSWSRAVIRNGAVLRSESEAWELGASGKDRYYFFDEQNGWPSGSYEVQFYIGDQLTDSVKFSITN